VGDYRKTPDESKRLGREGPILVTGMYSETAAEGTYVNVNREDVPNPLTKALSLIHTRAWSSPRLE